MTRNPVRQRAARRTEQQSAETDVAAVFERRLQARGIRTDDFLDWRNATDLPPIPSIVPIRFGRGVAGSPIEPVAAAEASPSVRTDEESSPDESGVE